MLHYELVNLLVWTSEGVLDDVLGQWLD
jgi:hypothetical protein